LRLILGLIGGILPVAPDRNMGLNTYVLENPHVSCFDLHEVGKFQQVAGQRWGGFGGADGTEGGGYDHAP